MEKFDSNKYNIEKENIIKCLDEMLNSFNEIYDRCSNLANDGSWEGENQATFVHDYLKNLNNQIETFKSDCKSIKRYMEKVNSEWSKM